MSYWNQTDQYLRSHRDHGPTCPKCGEEMFPQDDHGRFKCFCAIGAPRRSSPEIPQVDTTGMSDAEKTRIPPMNRLYAPPTAAETAYLAALRGESDAECESMRKALEKERGSE